MCKNTRRQLQPFLLFSVALISVWFLFSPQIVNLTSYVGFFEVPSLSEWRVMDENMACFWPCLIPPCTTSCFSKGWKHSLPSGNVPELQDLLYILQHLPCKEPKWLFNNRNLLALQEQWLMAETIPVGRKEKSMIIPQEYWSAPGISQDSSVTITSNSLYSNKLFLSMKQKFCCLFCIVSEKVQGRALLGNKEKKKRLSLVCWLCMWVREGGWKERTSFGAAGTTWATGRAPQQRQPWAVPPHSWEQPPPTSQFKEAFPPHKSPTSPLLLVLVFGEEYKYSYVLFVQLPFKMGILSSHKRQNPNGEIQTVWWMQQGPAASCSCGSWSDPCLKLPRVVGELNTASCHLALSLPFRLIVFAPLFWGRAERFPCLGMAHNYLKLFIALPRHCSECSHFHVHPSPCAALLARLLLFPWLRSLSSLLLYSAQFLLWRISFLCPTLVCCPCSTRSECLSQEGKGMVDAEFPFAESLLCCMVSADRWKSDTITPILYSKGKQVVW